MKQWSGVGAWVFLKFVCFCRRRYFSFEAGEAEKEYDRHAARRGGAPEAGGRTGADNSISIFMEYVYLGTPPGKFYQISTFLHASTKHCCLCRFMHAGSLWNRPLHSRTRPGAYKPRHILSHPAVDTAAAAVAYAPPTYRCVVVMGTIGQRLRLRRLDAIQDERVRRRREKERLLQHCFDRAKHLQEHVDGGRSGESTFSASQDAGDVVEFAGQSLFTCFHKKLYIRCREQLWRL